MNKKELINDLEKLKKGILQFQNKKVEAMNIPESIVEKEDVFKKYKNGNYNKDSYKSFYLLALREASKKIHAKNYEYKSKVKKDYGKLEKYIKKLGQNPAINNFSCYDAFFLNDNDSGENNNYKSIISDIDIIIGKLGRISDRELNNLIEIKKDYWKISHPIYWIIYVFKFILKHKIIFSILGILLTAVIGAIFVDSLKPLTEKISIPISEFLSGSINKYF